MKKYKLIFLLILIAFSDNYSQDFWERISGLDGLTIFSLAINSSGDIFAGADTSYGVFRSTDNGNSWTSGLDTLQINGIVIKSNGEILVSTLDYLLGGGVFHSTDNGDNWTNLGYTGATTTISMNSVGDIFAGTFGNGIVRSTDDGATWDVMNVGLPANSQISALAISPGDTVYTAAYNRGAYRSTDNGESWELIGFSDTVITYLAINSGGAIFTGTSGGGIFRSTNNGENWVHISSELVGEALFISAITIDQNGDVFAGTAGGIFHSTDNGENWVEINQGLINDNVCSLAMNSNGDIYTGTEDGIFRTIPSAHMKIFLQGPYVSATGTMNTTLKANGYIPLTQPYNTAPWNYAGTESVVTIPAGVVDWILLELRSDLTTQVSRRAAFLLSDGSVVDLDGVSNVKFPGVAPGDYYTVIRHRNHLAVMTANPVTLSFSPVLYDFSAAQTQAYGTSSMVSLTGGFGLYAGDPNKDGQITALDFNTWNANTRLGQTGYVADDMNLDAQVTALDFNFWNSNTRLGAITNVP